MRYHNIVSRNDTRIYVSKRFWKALVYLEIGEGLIELRFMLWLNHASPISVLCGRLGETQWQMQAENRRGLAFWTLQNGLV